MEASTNPKVLFIYYTFTKQARYLGIKIPPSNLQPDGEQAARAFGTTLVDTLAAKH
jgi:hypothetical protein